MKQYNMYKDPGVKTDDETQEAPASEEVAGGGDEE